MDHLHYRDAGLDDLDFLVELMDRDPVAAARDLAHRDDRQQQTEAMKAIAFDPNHRLLIVELDQVPVGSFQLSFIPGVSRQGAWRGQIESVRVVPERQGQGIGSAMMQWAVAECRRRGCGLVQLTSDRNRPDAHRFYERLGFRPTHSGFKLKLR